MLQDGYCVNLGDPFISFRVSGSRCGQVSKDKDALISKRKSELLVWYSEFGKAKHMGKGQRR
jgi:hypothetical protein